MEFKPHNLAIVSLRTHYFYKYHTNYLEQDIMFKPFECVLKLPGPGPGLGIEPQTLLPVTSQTCQCKIQWDVLQCTLLLQLSSSMQ